MPGPRLPMRKIHDVLRLSAAGMSKRKIAASLGVSATAAGECIRRARRAGLGWPLPEGLTEETLELRSTHRRQWRPRIVGPGRTGRRCIASCAGQG
jgi:transposase